MLERLTENQIKALIEGLWLSKEQLSELGFDNDWIKRITNENDDICNCDYDPIDNDELIDNLLNKRLI